MAALFDCSGAIQCHSCELPTHRKQVSAFIEHSSSFYDLGNKGIMLTEELFLMLNGQFYSYLLIA